MIFFFFLLNVLPGAYVAKPDPFLFANIISYKKLVINTAASGEGIQTRFWQGRVLLPSQAAPREEVTGDEFWSF